MIFYRMNHKLQFEPTKIAIGEICREMMGSNEIDIIEMQPKDS